MLYNIKVSAMEIIGHPGLDRITVFWQDFNQGQGQVTILCYGHAWTCYWEAMGKETVREFFLCCGNDYLVPKLAITQHHTPKKNEEKYLGQIIDAIKKELRGEGKPESGVLGTVDHAMESAISALAWLPKDADPIRVRVRSLVNSGQHVKHWPS